MIQDESYSSQAKNTINNRSNGISLFVNFTFNTSGKNVFLIYTSDGSDPSKSNGSVVNCSFSNFNDPNSTFVGSIPSSSFVAGNTLKYIFYISDSDLAAAWGRVAGTSGYSTSWTEGDDYYTSSVLYSNSSSGGNWSEISSWHDNVVPNLSTKSVEIISSTSEIVVNQDATVSTLKVFNDGEILFENSPQRTLTIANNGSLSNNGTFTAGTGKVSFAGSGTVSGTVVFNDVDISGGVNFGSSSTIDGTLTINAGGFVNTNAPTYGAAAALVYNTGGPYGRGAEWSTTTGAGYPNHVTISNNTTLNLGNAAASTARQCAGNLTVDVGSTLSLNTTPMTAALTVKGNFINNGTTVLSSSSGGDLKLEGDFDDNGTFTANSRAVFFEGNATQTIDSNTDPLEIDVMRMDKTGGEVVMNQNLLVDETADPLQFGSGTNILNLNGFKLTIGKTGVTSNITGTGSFKGSSTSKIEVLGNGVITLNLDQTTPGTTNALGTLTVNRPTGVVTIGTAATIPAAGVWTIEPSSKLTVSGTLTNQNTSGGIVLASPTSSGPSGSLILDKTNGFTGSGKITAKRYIAAYTTAEDGWHLFASPFDNFDVTGTNLEPSSTLNEEDDLYYWDEAVGDNGTWMNWKASSFNLDAGKGYLISSFASETKSWTGTPYHDDKVFSDLSYQNPHPTENNTWHLLGNPFTSALIWNNSNGWSLSGIGGVAKVMDVTDGSYIDINVGGVIPAFQGFFVSVENSTNSITISRDARSHEATNFYKSAGQYVKLSANDIDKALAQESNLYFNENGSETFDYRTDSRMLPLYAPGFYSLKDNHKLSTNTLPAINEELVIPFGFESNGSSNFEIELKESTVAYPIFLTDNKTGTIHKLSENPVYSFTASEGDDPNRFLLHFGVVGIGEQEQAPTLQAYMVDNRLYVNNSLEQAQLAVYDLQGRLVAEQSLNTAGLQALPLELPAGVYIVRLNNASESRSLKINVQ